MGKLLHKRIDYTGVSPYEFVPVTEAEYNALTPAEQEDETKMYWLYDADTVSADIDDESVSSGKVWSSEKVSSEISDVQDQVDTNTDDISTLNSAIDNFFDVVQTVQSFAAATSLSYTGKSITIPAKSFYSLMFNISYSNSLPQEICLSKSPTDVNPYNVFGRSSTALYLPLSGYTGNTPLTIYVWAKYATAATNNLYINGVTKTLG